MSPLPDGVQEFPPDADDEAGAGSAVELTDDQLVATINGLPQAPAEVEEVQEEVKEEEPEPEQAPSEPEPTPEPEPLTEVEMLKLQNQMIQEQLEQTRRQHDKLAGMYGSLKQQITAPTKEREPSYTDDGVSGEIQQLRAEIDNLRNAERQRRLETANRAVIEEAQAFAAQFADVQTLKEEMAAELSKREASVKTALESDDPDLARAEARRALFESYYAVKMARLSQARTKSEQSESMRQKKVVAAVSGGSGSPSARPKAKTLETMTDAELAALINS